MLLGIIYILVTNPRPINQCPDLIIKKIIIKIVILVGDTDKILEVNKRTLED